MGFTNGSTMNLVLDGTNNITLSFSGTDTINSIKSDLANYGITADVSDSGVFSATSTAHTFTLGGTLGTYLTQGTSGYTTTTTAYKSNPQLTATTKNATDISNTLTRSGALSNSTKLSDLGFTNGASVNIIWDGR